MARKKVAVQSAIEMLHSGQKLNAVLKAQLIKIIADDERQEREIRDNQRARKHELEIITLRASGDAVKNAADAIWQGLQEKLRVGK